MLTRHQASLDDRKKFTALVKDLFPDQAKNVNLLLMAYNMGIAQDIQTASHINNTFAFRYVKQLMDDFGMSRVNADWIVSVWCLIIPGLSEPPVRTLRAICPENESHIFR